MFGQNTNHWLGDGSLSLVLGFNVSGHTAVAERFGLVAGAARGSGQFAFAWDGARPRIFGRIAAESLPLPSPDWRGSDPLPLEPLRALDAEIAFSAQRVETGSLPVLEDASGVLRLDKGALRVELAQGRVAGGDTSGVLALETGSAPPRLSVEGRVAGAELAGPLTGAPVDLTAGRLDASAKLNAEGNSGAALLATLTGEAELEARDGVLTGLDAVTAARAAVDLGREETLRPPLLEGVTKLHRPSPSCPRRTRRGHDHRGAVARRRCRDGGGRADRSSPCRAGRPPDRAADTQRYRGTRARRTTFGVLVTAEPRA